MQFFLACFAALVFAVLAVLFRRIRRTRPVTPGVTFTGRAEELRVPRRAGNTGQLEDEADTSGDVEHFGDVVVKGLGGLRRLGKAKCGLVTILGPPKQGKSFLLNQLTKSCQFSIHDDILGGGTGGINICHPITANEFSSYVRTTAPTGAESGSTSALALAFADTVGLGGGVARDTSHLVTSLLPLSRVLIFNWMGGFQVDAILQQLGMFTCRVIPLLPANSEGRLGFLHIVLRDIDQRNEMQMNNLLLLPEPVSSSDSPENAAVERNEIRATLNKTFRRICVLAMPHPFVKVNSVRIFHAFTQKVDRLRKRIAHQVEHQSGHGLDAVTGASIADRLPSLLNSTVASSTVSVQSPFSAFQKTVAREAISLYQQQLRNFTDDMKQRYPMPEDDVKQSLFKKGSQLRRLLHNAMGCVTSQSRLQTSKAEADKLYSFHFCNALEDNRRHKKEALQQNLLQAKDQIVRRLFKEFDEDESRSEIVFNKLPEERRQILLRCPWLDKQEAQRVTEEVTAFAKLCLTRFETSLIRQAKILLEEQLEMERARAENLADSLNTQLFQSEQSRLDDREKYERNLEEMQSVTCDVEEKLTISLEMLLTTTEEAERRKEEAAVIQQQLKCQLKQEAQERNSERLIYRRKVEDINLKMTLLEKDREEERLRSLAEKEQLERKKKNLMADVKIQRAANRELVKKADELKKENLDLEERLGGHMVDWRWLNDKDEWQSYDDCTIEKIEQAYKGQEGKVKVSLGRWNYEVDLTKVGNMTQTNLETKTVRKVKREKLVFSGYPENWESQLHDLHKVQIPDDDEEFKRVEKLFHQSISRAKFKIVGLQRIQHRFLWHEYQLAKQRTHRKNKGQANERELFHGTRCTKPEMIYSSEKGFDMRFANNGLWGTGTYFAEKAIYSDRYAYWKNSSSPRQIFLAKVLLGIGQSDAPQDKNRRIPDLRLSVDGAQRSGGEGDIQYRYDSLNGVTGGSRVHIIFDNGHAYPYYLIDYLDI